MNQGFSVSTLYSVSILQISEFITKKYTYMTMRNGAVDNKWFIEITEYLFKTLGFMMMIDLNSILKNIANHILQETNKKKERFLTSWKKSYCCKPCTILKNALIPNFQRLTQLSFVSNIQLCYWEPKLQCAFQKNRDWQLKQLYVQKSL